MTETLDPPALPQGGSGTAPPKGKRAKATTEPAPEPEAAPAAPVFRKGQRVRFWFGAPDALDYWAADVVMPFPGTPGLYGITALTPGQSTYFPAVEASFTPADGAITPDED